MKLTKKERFATRVGSVLAIVAFMLSLVTISAIDASYADAIDEETGLLAPGREVLFDTNESADLQNPPYFVQSGCSPNIKSAIVGVYDENSTIGSDLMFNGSGPSLGYVCSPPKSKVYEIVYQLDITGSELVDLGTEVIGFGISIPATYGNGTLDLGLVPPGANGWQVPTVCATCEEYEITNGEEVLIPLTSDLVSFFESFPSHKVAFVVTSKQTDPLIPGLGEIIYLDAAAYGLESSGSSYQISDNLVQSFGADNMLSGMYYFVGLMSMIAAALIWPSSSVEKLQKKFSRGGR